MFIYIYRYLNGQEDTEREAGVGGVWTHRHMTIAELHKEPIGLGTGKGPFGVSWRAGGISASSTAMV